MSSSVSFLEQLAVVNRRWKSQVKVSHIKHAADVSSEGYVLGALIPIQC
jgi:hypothetical protein